MKLVAHLPGIGKAPGVELPDAVTELPGVALIIAFSVRSYTFPESIVLTADKSSYIVNANL